MADYFTHCCFALDATAEQRAALAADNHRRWNYDGTDFEDANRVPHVILDQDYHGDGRLVIRDDAGQVDLGALVDMLKRVLHDTASDRVWFFTASFTCSAPRTDAFGGIGVIVTRDSVVSQTNADWLDGQLLPGYTLTEAEVAAKLTPPRPNETEAGFGQVTTNDPAIAAMVEIHRQLLLEGFPRERLGDELQARHREWLRYHVT